MEERNQVKTSIATRRGKPPALLPGIDGKERRVWRAGFGSSKALLDIKRPERVVPLGVALSASAYKDISLRFKQDEPEFADEWAARKNRILGLDKCAVSNLQTRLGFTITDQHSIYTVDAEDFDLIIDTLSSPPFLQAMGEKWVCDPVWTENLPDLNGGEDALLAAMAFQGQLHLLKANEDYDLEGFVKAQWGDVVNTFIDALNEFDAIPEQILRRVFARHHILGDNHIQAAIDSHDTRKLGKILDSFIPAEVRRLL